MTSVPLTEQNTASVPYSVRLSTIGGKNCPPPPPRTTVATLKFGKYKGKSFKYVSINYPAYAGIIELQSPSKHFRDFLRFFYNWKLNEFNNIL